MYKGVDTHGLSSQRVYDLNRESQNAQASLLVEDLFGIKVQFPSLERFSRTVAQQFVVGHLKLKYDYPRCCIVICWDG